MLGKMSFSLSINIRDRFYDFSANFSFAHDLLFELSSSTKLLLCALSSVSL